MKSTYPLTLRQERALDDMAMDLPRHSSLPTANPGLNWPLTNSDVSRED